MKRTNIWRFLGLVFILTIPLIIFNFSSSSYRVKSINADLKGEFFPLITKKVSNITLILNYNDGENITIYNITLIGDISPYNATLVVLGDQNINEYWAINGVFVKGLRINGTWYTNGDNGRNWLYYVNGILPGVSSSVFELTNDSVVEWRFTAADPFQGQPNLNGDFWLIAGIVIGVIGLCAVAIILIIKKGM